MERAAFADGALAKKIEEFVAIGIEMGGGPATAHARFALQVMASVFSAGDKKVREFARFTL